jgi:F-type H+-transporting ATPase subunit a
MQGLDITSAMASSEPSFAGTAFYVLLVLVVIAFFVSLARKGFNGRIFKNKPAQIAEQLYLFIENMALGAIGPHGKKYIPMMISFWLVIFVSNLVALFFPVSPTTVLGFNLGLALVSIGYVQHEGVKANGLFGHVSHFAGPKLGLGLIPITLMLFCIEIFSEIMKNISLSIRIFANMSGGHRAVEAMNELGHGINVPFGEFLLPLKVLTCLVQAMIFTLLSCVYLGLVTHHDDHGHEEGHDNTPAHAH